MVFYNTGMLIPFAVMVDLGKRDDVMECVLNSQFHKYLSCIFVERTVYGIILNKMRS